MTEQKPGHDRLDMIRKLLAKAENPAATAAEAEAFNAKAAALIAKYGIEQALLDANRTDGQQAVVGDRIIRVPAPYAGEKSALLYNVAKPLRVRTVRRPGKRSEGFDVHLFGFDADLGRVDILFTSLLVQAAHGLTNVRPTHWGESVTGYRKAWMAGFTNAVAERLEAAETRAKQEADGPSTDLVLANRDALVNRRVEEVYSELRTLRAPRVLDSGYNHGRAAGQRADLGDTRTDGAGRPSQRPVGR